MIKLQQISEKLFVFGSDFLLPRWCKEDGHWTFKVLDFFWVDCPCCLFFRGVTIGLALSVFINIAAIVIVLAFLRS